MGHVSRPKSKIDLRQAGVVHRHTHTRNRKLARKHTLMYTHIYIYKCTYTHMYLSMCVLVRVYINMCVHKISKKNGGREDDTNLYVYTWICHGTVASNKSNHQSTLVSEHRLCGSQLEQAMDRVDWFRTSADERVLSVQRAVVMV